MNAHDPYIHLTLRGSFAHPSYTTFCGQVRSTKENAVRVDNQSDLSKATVFPDSFYYEAIAYKTYTGMDGIGRIFKGPLTVQQQACPSCLVVQDAMLQTGKRFTHRLLFQVLLDHFGGMVKAAFLKEI